MACVCMNFTLIMNIDVQISHMNMACGFVLLPVHNLDVE